MVSAPYSDPNGDPDHTMSDPSEQLEQDPAESAELSDFEGSLDELEALVEQMETGELSLEESLAAFERGVALTRSCQQALRQAELKVATLTADDESPDED